MISVDQVFRCGTYLGLIMIRHLQNLAHHTELINQSQTVQGLQNLYH